MKHAVRLWTRQPLLAAAAIVSLALGIGANTAIFSVLHAVVLRPLPYPDADRLVVVWETSPDNPARWVAPANFIDWRRESRSFSSLAAFDGFSMNLTGRSEPERLRAGGASGTFFATLGVSAAIGRTPLPEDDEPGATPVAVLTDGLWRRLFGGSPAAVGETLTLDGRAHTIVGVLPAGFSMPMLREAEIWVASDRGIPRSFPFPGDITTVRDSHILYVVGRLAEGVSPEVARQDVAAIMARLEREHPDTNKGLGAAVVGLHEQVVGNVRPLVALLQLAVALLLAIGCANVASLVMGQAAGRRTELATRVALGAGRGSLVRQLLAETMVIALPGGALGLLLAAWGLDGLVALAPAELPRTGEIGLNGTVLLFTLAVTLGTAVAFGLGPALTSSRVRVSAATEAGLRVAGDRSVRHWHRVMTVTELALAQVLLVGAGLLLASLMAAQRVDLGFAADGRIAADFSLAPDRYLRPRPGMSEGDFSVDVEPKRQFVDRVLERLRATPGVRAAAASFTAPMAGAPNRGVSVDETPEQSGALGPAADFQVVTPQYFRTLGITLVSGRDFDENDRDDRPRVAVVNQAFASRYLAGRDPIGRVIRFGPSARHEIVGVVADARYRDIEQAADPTFYVPLAQNDERWPFLSFTAWADEEPARLAPVIREAVRSADPVQPIARIRTYDEILAAGLAPRRFNTLLVGLFALTALVMAAVGTYGVMAYAVVSRTRELGVRAALGAGPSALGRLVLGQGAGLCGVALGVGLAGAWLGARSLGAMLFQVQPRDPWIFGSVAVMLTVVALVAAWLPARRATRLSPLAALREM
jgi:predicted permease